MRCLHIITRLYNGGAEEAVLQLIRSLSLYNVQCDLVVGNIYEKAMLDKFPLPSSCSVIQVPQLRRNPHLIQDIQAVRILTKLIQKNAYQIVHTHTAKAGILGRYAAKKAKTNTVVHTAHTVSFGIAFNPLYQYIYKSLEKWAGLFTHRFIFVSQELQNTYLQAKVATKDKSSIVYVGMDLEPFRKAAKNTGKEKKELRKKFGFSNNSDEIILGCVARISATKKQETLIQLLPKILETQPNTHLVFFGAIEKDYQDTLIALSISLSINERIHFLGFKTELWKYISLIDIHCFSSIHEGLPLVLVQCSAAGIPSVCFRCSGVDEIIAHNKSGFIFEQGQTDDFIRGLLSLMQNKTKRKAFGQEAQRRSKGNEYSNWDMHHYATATKEIYTHLLEQSL